MTGEAAGGARVGHYDAQYANFRNETFSRVRAEAFGLDYGQNGWQTADELERFVAGLALHSGSRLLDVACGSGGPALRIAEKTRCSVVGVDLHADGIATARATAKERGLETQATFLHGDASRALPFEKGAFDAILCVDAINHLPDRARVLAEWARLLAPGGRLVYTDPIVVTGWLSDEEMRVRSSVGFFLFFPMGLNERLLGDAGFEVVSVTNATENMASMAGRWRAARERHEGELRRIEGDEAFTGQQRFFDVAARLAAERRLSRFEFVAMKNR